jgi:multiple sugar transport system permease protein
VPWAVPAAVSARVWELIYNFHYGLLNSVLEYFPAGAGPINWLGTPLGAAGALIAADVWKTTPFVAIILLAGLSAIPENIHRQAQIDGAGFVRRLFRITVPLLRPILVVCFLFRTIDALRVFDLVYILSGGGPGGSTTSLSLYGYRYYVGGDYGYGSAVSVVLFLCALALSVLYVHAGRYREEVA